MYRYSSIAAGVADRRVSGPGEVPPLSSLTRTPGYLCLFMHSPAAPETPNATTRTAPKASSAVSGARPAAVSRSVLGFVLRQLLGAAEWLRGCGWETCSDTRDAIAAPMKSFEPERKRQVRAKTDFASHDASPLLLCFAFAGGLQVVSLHSKTMVEEIMREECQRSWCGSSLFSSIPRR